MLPVSGKTGATFTYEKQMTIQIAKTIGELIEKLIEISKEHGEDCVWHGWDDGSLIIDNEREGEFSAIQPQ